MKFTVSSSALSSRLSAISRVINPKAIYPILEDFLFRIENGKLTVTAADNDTTLETIIDLVDSSADGQIALPAKTLLDALKEIPEQPLTFNVNDSNYEITVTTRTVSTRWSARTPTSTPPPPYFRRVR